MKQNSKLKRLAFCTYIALITNATQLSQANASGFDPAHQTLGGNAWLTFNQDALATVAPESYHSDVHGSVLDNRATSPTANINGQRLLYVHQFADSSINPALKPTYMATDAGIADGTADPEAVAQWRLLTPEDRVPILSPEGGWEMPVDPWDYGTKFSNFLAPGYTPSAYDPSFNSSNPVLISLGGNVQFASDFHAPSGSIWMRGLGLSLERTYASTLDPTAPPQNAWYLVSSVVENNPGQGKWFQLKNPVFGANEDGMLTLDSDIMIGDANMGFLIGQFGNTKTLGHITINLPNTAAVAPVPLPTAAWLFGSGLFGLVGLRRRKSLS
ncbi:hypothetical protein HC024_15690 [Methylococcaceae bacterium WWC4]|nr:hypothetical protein [Methylococcaceae bacterium WWC4]